MIFVKNIPEFDRIAVEFGVISIRINMPQCGVVRPSNKLGKS